MSRQSQYKMVKAKSEDLLRVHEILESCGLPTQGLTRDYMKHFYILESDTQTIGTIGLEIYGRYGLLRSLAVSKDHRGLGLGKKLVRKLESYSQSKGIDKLFLLTTTADEFFRRVGYTEVPRPSVPEPVLLSEEFSQICPGSATVFMKEILIEGCNHT